MSEGGIYIKNMQSASECIVALLAQLATVTEQRDKLLAAAKASLEDCILVICEEDAVYACKEVMRRLEPLCAPKQVTDAN